MMSPIEFCKTTTGDIFGENDSYLNWLEIYQFLNMFFLNPITDTTKEFNFDLQIYLSKSKNNNSESKLNED